MSCVRLLSMLCCIFFSDILYAAAVKNELSFSRDLESRNFAHRSHSIGFGYLPQAYTINAQLEGTTGYPSNQLKIRPIEMNVKTEHIFLQVAALGPASFYNFWLGYKTVIGYAFSAQASSIQSPYPITIKSTYLSHQQMLGYFMGGIRIYTMLGITSDWLMKAEMNGGDEILNKVGPDGIFAHSGVGAFMRFVAIVLNVEMRIPVWQANYNRDTGIHGLFSIGYEIFD